jgi:hypothetical protein
VTEEHELIGRDALGLAAALIRSPEGQTERIRQLGGLLAELQPLDPEACDALARVLQVPTGVAEAWLSQTDNFMQHGTVQLELDDERWPVMMERLTVLGWAWCDPAQRMARRDRARPT